MNNIEKFEKVKELSRLKGEYHKRELLRLVTFQEEENKEVNSLMDWISVGKSGVDLYHQIKSLIG